MLREFTPAAEKNLMMLLDRVPLKGHKERAAMNEIEKIMATPIKEEKKTPENTTDEKKQ